MFIYLKSQSEYRDIPLIVFDDISKYMHLIDNCNSDIIRQICDSQYHNEILYRVRELTLNIYCIKSNTFRKINVEVDGSNWI